MIRDVVEAAQCGLFVEPGNAPAMADAIHKMANNLRKSRGMGLSGRRYLEGNFSREAIGEKLVNLLETMNKSANISNRAL